VFDKHRCATATACFVEATNYFYNMSKEVEAKAAPKK